LIAISNLSGLTGISALTLNLNEKLIEFRFKPLDESIVWHRLLIIGSTGLKFALDLEVKSRYAWS